MLRKLKCGNLWSLKALRSRKCNDFCYMSDFAAVMITMIGDVWTSSLLVMVPSWCLPMITEWPSPKNSLPQAPQIIFKPPSVLQRVQNLTARP